MDKRKMFAVGAHTSISHGVEAAIEEMSSMKGGIAQIFISSPIGRAPADLVKRYKDEAEGIKATCKRTNVQLVIHSPYILNFAKPFDKNGWWVKALWNELQVSEAIGSIGCVIHVGKHLDLPIEAGLDNMFRSIQYILEKMHEAKMYTKLILETAAGQGSELLRSLREFAEFYDRFNATEKRYLKVCIDTCHIFVAGHDIGATDKVHMIFNALNDTIGFDNIALIHLNDAKEPMNSQKDRHECIGDGYIGTTPLIEVVKVAKKQNIPVVLETPSNHAEEIKLILSKIQK